MAKIIGNTTATTMAIPAVVKGGAYIWSYTENDTSLGIEESENGLETIIYAFDGMPEVVLSDISVHNYKEDASLGVAFFKIYAKCEINGGGHIEWTTEAGETVSHSLTTEYQPFSSMEASTFSIHCTNTVTLSPIADPSEVGLVSVNELSYIAKELVNKADINHTHNQIDINARIDNGILILSKNIH